MTRNKEGEYDPNVRHEPTGDPKGELARPPDVVPAGVDPDIENTSLGDEPPMGNLGNGNHWVDRTPTDA